MEPSPTPPPDRLHSPPEQKTEMFTGFRTGKTPAPPSLSRVRTLVNLRDKQFQKDVYDLHKRICYENFEFFDPEHSDDAHLDLLIAGWSNSEAYAQKLIEEYYRQYDTDCTVYLEIVQGYFGHDVRYNICVNPNPSLCQRVKQSFANWWNGDTRGYEE